MSEMQGLRCSQGKKDIGEARSFPWEYPVPDNKFWGDLPFATARSFLESFSAEDAAKPPIDPDSTLEPRQKLELLDKLAGVWALICGMAPSYAPISAEERFSSETLRPTALRGQETVEPFLEDENAGDGSFSGEKHSDRPQLQGNRLSLIALLSNFVPFVFAINFYFFKYTTAAPDDLC
ncbi:hypothetical protein F5B21DRAFT_504171 [Xylaria acuta]|nr:hypothetical protein F5B21DRAFT_504171 [Xylaria acuta]